MTSAQSTLTSEHLPVTSLIHKKSLPKHNILVGEELAQVNWLEQRLDLKVTRVERVTDESILGKEASILQVYNDSQIDLSPQVREQVGVWAALPLTRTSAGWNALIRSAPSILGVSVKSLPKNYGQFVTNQLPKKEPTNLMAALWSAVNILSAPLDERGRWLNPWEDQLKWLPSGVDPAYRLHTLYRELVGYVYLRRGVKEGIKKFGLSPSKQKRFSTLSLPTDQVRRTLVELSRWKSLKTPPIQCALRVAAIWAK